jgi:hypothetical protein
MYWHSQGKKPMKIGSWLGRRGSSNQTRKQGRLPAEGVHWQAYGRLCFHFPAGHDVDLEFWVDLALAYNPLAKKSKGRFQPI